MKLEYYHIYKLNVITVGSVAQRVYPYFHGSFLQVVLGWCRVNDCPVELELPAGARNIKKATLKIRRNPLRHETDYTPL